MSLYFSIVTPGIGQVPKDEWAINKSQQQFVQEQKTQASNSSTKNSDDSNVKSEAKNEPTAGWTGLDYSFAQSNSLRDCILLDSDSTDTLQTFEIRQPIWL